MLLLSGAILEKVFINPQLQIMEAIMSDIKNLNYLIFAVVVLGGLAWGAGSAWLGYSLGRGS
jgi:hypothetical protein